MLISYKDKKKGDPTKGNQKVQCSGHIRDSIETALSIVMIVVTIATGRKDSPPAQPQIIVQGDGNTVAIESR